MKMKMMSKKVSTQHATRMISGEAAPSVQVSVVSNGLLRPARRARSWLHCKLYSSTSIADCPTSGSDDDEDNNNNNDNERDNHKKGAAIDGDNVQAASHKSYPWEYWPREEGRSECGHVGLLNLGATCYMATAVQQLFMIPATRACILQGDGLGPTDPSFGKHLSTLYELRR